MEELTLMGLLEVVSHVPGLLQRMTQTVSVIRKLQPDVVVTIDAPGFCFRVARRLKSHAGTKDIPILHYVAPSVWAWAPGRARRVVHFLDYLLTLLPFEPHYFEAEGLPSTCVGHPVMESGADNGDGPSFRARHGIAPDTKILCILPGSRANEITRLLPIFGKTLKHLVTRFSELNVVVPMVPALASYIESVTNNWPLPVTLLCDEKEKFHAFAAADAALAASGTVSLELAMAGVPMVVAYRMNWLTAWLTGRLVRVKYVSLVNLLLNREAIIEFLQGNCRPKSLARTLETLLMDATAGEEQRAAFAEALALIRQGGERPSLKAAQLVLSHVRKSHLACR
jgi:lipid-A-disaccharide synthase